MANYSDHAAEVIPNVGLVREFRPNVLKSGGRNYMLIMVICVVFPDLVNYEDGEE